MMLFGEKYPEPVRMVSMGSFSGELCGGTHLSNTREVERFELLSEEGVSAGTRRITALTGRKAAEHASQVTAAIEESARLLRVAPIEVADASMDLMHHARELRKQMAGGGEAKPLAKRKSARSGVTASYEELKNVLAET